MGLFPLVVLLDAAFLSEQSARDDLATVCESVCFVPYSVITLYFWMKDMEYNSITATPQFWIVSAILIYFGGNIFVFASSNYAISIGPSAFNFVWAIHALIGMAYYIIVSIGFWKVRKQYQ